MSAPAPVVSIRTVRLPLSPAEAWPLLSNTGRLNKSMGMPAVDAGPKEGLTKNASSRVMGLELRWLEYPFEWSASRFYRVRRDFPSGPFVRFEAALDVRPAPEGCEATFTWTFTPRGALGAALARLTLWRAAGAMEALVRALAKRPSAQALPRKARPTVDEALLEARARALFAAPVEAEGARRLVELLRTGFDDEVSAMRPFVLADRWRLDRVQVLRVFLHAVKAGLLELRWQLLCPHCLAGEAAPSLSDIPGRARCEGCGVGYGVDLDESLELRFTAHKAVRSSMTRVFCVGNPSQAPFVLSQVLLDAPGRKTVDFDWPEDSLILRDMGAKKCLRLRPDGAAGDLKVDLGSLADGATLSFRPGPGSLEVSSKSPTFVRVEAEDWKARGAKASIVTSLQEFRSLFSAEVVSAGAELTVGRVTLLFSDLKSSTALYERIGDAPAYAMVRDHFDFLFEIVQKHRGAVVKTIGDAVMAVFSRAHDGLLAALEIQERAEELNARLAPKPEIIIKLGLHEGPAIAINAGGVLDYFGTTVNVAARVQNESEGGDVVLSRRIFDDPAASGLLASRGWKGQDFEIALKGLEGPYRLTRLTRHA